MKKENLLFLLQSALMNIYGKLRSFVKKTPHQKGVEEIRFFSEIFTILYKQNSSFLLVIAI